AYVITTSLYAYAFGSYGATFLSSGSQGAGAHVLISAAIVVITALNVLSAKLIAAAEDYIVVAKITILVAFVSYAMFRTDLSASGPSHWESPASLVAGGMLVFVAYEGFELIANAAGDIRDPRRTIPRALYTSVLFTIVLYMLVAVVTVGLLSAAEIVRAADFALAEAAQQVWGGVGFNLIV
ncbi:MAG: amino acid permease, partial [Propionibacteriaceae bacterium]|nr:amino acid permease [Propionibacteriaceae bacterium]